MKCKNCGFNNRTDARFCQQCGQSLPAASVEPSPPAGATCPACGTKVKPGAHYCPKCGGALPASGVACAACGTTVKPGARFCPHCGKSLPVKSASPLSLAPAQPKVPATPASSLPQIPPPQPGSRGQVIYGDKNIQIGAIHGSRVNIFSGPAPQAHPLNRPVSMRPTAIKLLDRKPEVSQASSLLRAFQSVEFHGQAGIGKTTLLHSLAHHNVTAYFPDGVVYHSLLYQSGADGLQQLFDYFYRRDPGFIPPYGDIRRALRSVRALILLDDMALNRDEMKMLMDSMPGCTFVLASSKHRLWGQHQLLALAGLPPDAALTLVERELGRSLTPKERSVAQKLTTTLAGHPLNLRRAAARIRDQKLTLTRVLDQIQKAPSPSQALTTHLLASLSEKSRRALAVLAALDGAKLRTDHLAALAGLSEAMPVLQPLMQQGLVQAHSPYYSLAGDLGQVLQQTWDLTPWAERALTYFTAWVEGHQSTPERLTEETGPILRTLEWAAGASRRAEVLRLGQAIEGALILNARWDAWARVLHWGRQAARGLGDQAGEAWTLHQLGSRALCLGDAKTARSYLTDALQLRQALGDQAGTAVTQHNLNLLIAPPPASQPQPKPAPKPAPPKSPPARHWWERLADSFHLPTWSMPILVPAALALIVVLAGIVLAIGGFWVFPTSSSPTVAASFPSPTVAASFPTPTDTATSTSSPIPPSPTDTAVPTDTPTPVDTTTAIPFTTPTSTSTNTSTPTDTPTSTGTSTPTGTSTATPSPPPTFTPTRPPSINFVASPQTIDQGQCSTLQWQIENVQAAFLSGGVFNNRPVTGPFGSERVCPDADTMYTLRVVLLNNDEERRSVFITVIALPTPTHTPTNQPPSVRITQPAADSGTNNPEYENDGSDSFGRYTIVRLQGRAVDPEDGALSGSSLVWTTNRTDIHKAPPSPILGTGANVTARLYLSGCPSEGRHGDWHEITLTATDSDGSVSRAVRRIYVWVNCIF